MFYSNKKILKAIVVIIFFVPLFLSAAELNLSNSPLYLGSNIAPNVFLQMDDSGSMDWEIMTVPHWEVCAYDNNTVHATYAPGSTDFYKKADCGNYITNGWWMGWADGGTDDWEEMDYIFDNSDNVYESHYHSNDCLADYFGWSAYGSTLEDCPQTTRDSDWRVYSSSLNVLYYNPDLTYTPWEGSGLADASFTSARSNPVSGSTGYSLTKNLTGFKWVVWEDDKGFSSNRPLRGDQINMTDGANGIVDWWDKHTEYTVESGSIDVVEVTYAYNASQTAIIETRTSLGSLASSEEATIKQNIANWYQYYRRRSMVSKAAIGAVIERIPTFRFGFSGLISSTFEEVPAASVTDFANHNADLLDTIYEYDIESDGNDGTPLRRALDRIGEYYDNTDGNTDPIIESCQQHFVVQMTDGHWNGSSTGTGDEDGDNISDTVADVAKYYYDKDLSSLDNEVPTNTFDTNDQQHMVTFTVAFGVGSSLADTNNDGWPDPTLEEADDWGDPSGYTEKPEKVNDLWHAAYNGRGAFVEAQTPEDLVNSLQSALEEISNRVGSSAAVAANSGSLTEGTTIFQARFNSTDWHGELLALMLNPDTATVSGVPLWDAGDKLPVHNLRNIISYNPDSERGIQFTWPNNHNNPGNNDLSDQQVSDILKYVSSSANSSQQDDYGEAVVDYLRGDESNEGTGTTYEFRERLSTKLGDIVNSDPQYVKKPIAGYSDDLETSDYSSFVSANQNRQGMIYVGANDGMLHAFNADSGVEEFAFIPSSVFSNLADLTQTNYSHQYYVDSAPSITDAYIGGWKTILAAGLGGGGQGIYALDITNPDEFSQANADDIVLWEFTDADDEDLGLTYSRPVIVKLNTGDWGAIFGNGYNNTYSDGNASSTGHAVLYIIDLSDGSLIKKIDTEAGSSSTPNGLATVSVVDDFDNPDGIADYVYAGDLLGNLWKFDISGSNKNQWDIAFTQGSNNLPLFSTKNAQPITTRPEVGIHPAGRDGYMIFFGTGKYLEPDDDDPTGAITQVFYGLWDQNDEELGDFNSVKSSLLQQSVIGDETVEVDTDGDGVADTNIVIRKTTDHDIEWDAPNDSGHLGWYIELTDPILGNRGEKQVHDSILRFERIFFNTTIPSSNICAFGGSSMLMALDATNGGTISAFDLNEDGSFTSEDEAGGEPVSGVGSDVLTSGGNVLSGTNTSGGDSGDGDGDGDSSSSVGCGRARVAYLVQSGSDGSVTTEELDKGSGFCGRQSWRVLE